MKPGELDDPHIKDGYMVLLKCKVLHELSQCENEVKYFNMYVTLQESWLEEEDAEQVNSMYEISSDEKSNLS